MKGDFRPRRSNLSVPATNPRFHEKAAASAADEVMFDLEDSVSPALKERARGMVVEALRKHGYPGKTRAVRVNALDSAWGSDDLRALVAEAADLVDCFVVPKVESAAQVRLVDELLEGTEIGLELQIESARGMLDADEICQASARSEALHLGPGDFGASMRFPELTIGGLGDADGLFWHPFLVQVALVARANGMQPIDGPYARVRDLDGLRESARRSARLGFEGKWALNPAQAEVLNEVYSPVQEEFDRASAIVEAYARAAGEAGTGAVMLGEEMIDEASRKMALAVIKRGRAFGMKARPWIPK